MFHPHPWVLWFAVPVVCPAPWGVLEHMLPSLGTWYGQLQSFTCSLNMPSKHPISEKALLNSLYIFGVVTWLSFHLLFCWCWVWNNLDMLELASTTSALSVLIFQFVCFAAKAIGWLYCLGVGSSCLLVASSILHTISSVHPAVQS